MHVHCTAARFFYSLCCRPRDRVTLASLATSRDSAIARLQHKLATRGFDQKGERSDMSRHGTIEEFDGATEDWTAYSERLEQYFVANE